MSTPKPTDVTRDPYLLHPVMLVKASNAFLDMHHDGIKDVYMFETYRTPQRQAQLYAQGRSSKGPIVTWSKISYHQFGLAFDLAFKDERGVWHWDGDFQRLWPYFRKHGLETIGGKDPGHYQLTGGIDLPTCDMHTDKTGLLYLWRLVAIAVQEKEKQTPPPPLTPAA